MILHLLRDLLRDPRRPRTLVVMDEGGEQHLRQYYLRPRRLLGLLGAGVALAALLLVALLLMTPARRLLLGPDPETLRQTAEHTARRAADLEDSLALQAHYLEQLRLAIVGEMDEAEEPAPPGHEPEAGPPGEAAEAGSEDWAHHQPPALALERLVAEPPAEQGGPAAAYLASLQFPVLPPLEGFLARGFDAARGHYAIDLAAEEGTPVRAIGDGYVVFADWTHDGGYTVALQHADGYLSIYKHNSRLLRRVGDRVRSREAIALSGNTGEVTTGPHLHFELWRSGLAQDPGLYLLGL